MKLSLFVFVYLRLHDFSQCIYHSMCFVFVLFRYHLFPSSHFTFYLIIIIHLNWPLARLNLTFNN